MRLDHLINTCTTGVLFLLISLLSKTATGCIFGLPSGPRQLRNWHLWAIKTPLQLINMKCGMDDRVTGQIKPVSYHTNPFNYFKWPNVSFDWAFYFPFESVKSVFMAVASNRPNHPLGIFRPLQTASCALEPLKAVVWGVVTWCVFPWAIGLQTIFYWLVYSLVEVLGNYNQKRCGLQRCVKIGIVPPFRQRNPFDPLFLLLKYHAPEVVFNALVNPLCLPVTLGVVCRT